MLLSLFLACSPVEPMDTGEPVVEEEEHTEDACEQLEIKVNGNDPPEVGDEWTVWLWCDDALMLGATRLFFEPPDFVLKLDDNNVEFVREGTATMTIQVGSRRLERDVTVSASAE